MPEVVKMKEFLDYIDKINKALYSVGWFAKFVPATFSPRIGVIVGEHAKMVTNHLYISGRIDRWYQFKHKGANAKIFAVQLKEM